VRWMAKKSFEIFEMIFLTFKQVNRIKNLFLNCKLIFKNFWDQ
jgi:hypothetical protein